MATLEIKKTSKLPKSSIIDRLSYDKVKCELTIFFENGNVYYYKNVPLNVVKGFSKTKSVGSYFVSNIKGKYAFKKLENSNEN